MLTFRVYQSTHTCFIISHQRLPLAMRGSGSNLRLQYVRKLLSMASAQLERKQLPSCRPQADKECQRVSSSYSSPFRLVRNELKMPVTKELTLTVAPTCVSMPVNNDFLTLTLLLAY